MISDFCMLQNWCVPGYPRNSSPHPGTENRNTAPLPNTLFQVFQGISILGNTKTSSDSGCRLCLRGEYNTDTLEQLEHRPHPGRSVAVFCSRVRWNKPATARRFEVMT